MNMKTVANLLDYKGREVWSVSPSATVYEALEILADKDVGALVVMDGRALVGVISERDYAREVVLRGRTSRDTKVEEIMSTELTAVSEQTSVQQCMEIMTEKRFRHLPVQSGDELVGLISIGDVVRATISDKDDLIGQLDAYIRGVA